MCPIDSADMLPAPGQGALALQCRRDHAECREVLATLHDAETAQCVELERQIVLGLDGDCHSPIAALAAVEGDQVLLRAAVGGRDGAPPVIWSSALAPMNDPAQAVVVVLADLARHGVKQRLKGVD
jgi:hydroxymethylbilane synthase